MADLARAYEEAKSLPDEALMSEIKQPSGMLPSYIAMAELSERKAMRGGSGAPVKKTSIADELLASFPSPRIPGYSEGGILSRLNPFHSYLEALQDPQAASGLQQDKINTMFGNQPPLMPLQAAGGPQPLQHTSNMIPQGLNQPERVTGFSGGGIASLFRR